MGANLKDLNNLKSSFLNSITNENIFIFLDMCYMFKLIRHCLRRFKQLKTNEGATIDWSFETLRPDQEEGIFCGLMKKMSFLAVKPLRTIIAETMNFLNDESKNIHFTKSGKTAKICRMDTVSNIFNLILTKETIWKVFITLKIYILIIWMMAKPTSKS